MLQARVFHLGEAEKSKIKEIVDDRQLKVVSQTLELNRTEQPTKPVESMTTEDDYTVETDDRQFQLNCNENPIQLLQSMSTNDTPDDTDTDGEQWDQQWETEENIEDEDDDIKIYTDYDEEDVPTF